MSTYRIVRFFFDVGRPAEEIAGGLSLEEARAWTNDVETSSSTATSNAAAAYTAANGPWFDGYTEER